jgi:REP element-mobilizing transposase RayT
MSRQHLNPQQTSWHITWETYGTRLHGDARPTVDRDHNQRGKEFIGIDPHRRRIMQEVMNFPARYLIDQQLAFVEAAIPAICVRGGWSLRICSAATDHVHVLCDVVPAVHGEKVRRLLKRWLGQELAKTWPLIVGQTFWAEEGSNKAVGDEAYLNNVFNYIFRQRATPLG